MTNQEIATALTKLPPKDIAELINMAGMVAVIMDARPQERVEMGLSLLRFAQAALIEEGCNIDTTIVSRIGIKVCYKNGVLIR